MLTSRLLLETRKSFSLYIQGCETLTVVWATLPGHSDCTVSTGNAVLALRLCVAHFW